jgi:hypothetical protein
MIKVTVGTNTRRTSVIVEPNRTLRSVLEDQEIDYSTGTLHLDGSTVTPGQLDKTFAELGITEKCFLISVVKADGAF